VSAANATEPSGTSTSEAKPPRGPLVAGNGKLFGIVILGVVALCLVAGIVIALISASNDGARSQRLKEQGIHVPVTVNNCLGLLGGTGSTPAGFVCHGTYVVDGKTYHEVIGAKGTFSRPGVIVAGVADPTQPSTVVTAQSASSPQSSVTAYVIVSLLALVLVGTLLWMVILVRRRRAERELVPTTQ